MLGHNGKYRLVIVVGKVIKVGIDGSEWLEEGLAGIFR